VRRLLWRHAPLVFLAAVLGPCWVVAIIADQQPPTVSAELHARAELAQIADQLAETQAALRVCQGQIAPAALAAARKEISASRDQIRQDFEAAHPGWTLNPVTLAVTPTEAPHGKP
jgi:hypothetical protein